MKLSHASAEVNMTNTENDCRPAGLPQRLQRWLRGESRPTLQLELDAIAPLSPFHLLLNGQGVVLQTGPSLLKLLGSDPMGLHWHQVIGTWIEDEEMPPEPLGDLEQSRNTLLRLAALTAPELELSGQLLLMHRFEPRRWLLDLRPVLENLDDLAEAGLCLQDLSLLDPLRTGMVTRLMEVSLRQELLQALHEQNP